MYKRPTVPGLAADFGSSDGYDLLIVVVIATVISTLATMVGLGLAMLG
jgi:hypothetical protein